MTSLLLPPRGLAFPLVLCLLLLLFLPSSLPSDIPLSPLDTLQSSPNSSDDQPSLIDYSSLYQRSPLHLRPLFLALLVLWLAFLFSFVGIVASDFFCPNLATISSRLGLSESLAGVTLLGFGNGAPDVFSTFAAMRANTGSLALGELVGAASFIVAVVVGSMAIITPFRVPRHAFLRDLGFFTAAIALVLLIIRDGQIVRWEAHALVALYIVYVGAVLFTTWSVERTRKRLELVFKVRSEFAEEGQITEPYLDNPDFPIQPTPDQALLIPELDSTLSPPSSPQLQPGHPTRPSLSPATNSALSSNSNLSFKGLLETNYVVPTRRMRAPSLSYRAAPGPLLLQPSAPRSNSSQDGGSIHDSRRRKRGPVQLNAIRPSLLGAIEFRDVVNSLVRESGGRVLGGLSPQISRPPGRHRSGSMGVLLRNVPRTHEGRRQSELPLPALSTHGLRAGHTRGSQSQSAIVPSSPSPWELEGFSHVQSRARDLSSGGFGGDRLGNQLDIRTGRTDTDWPARLAAADEGWGRLAPEVPATAPSPRAIETPSADGVPAIMITTDLDVVHSLPNSARDEWDKDPSEPQEGGRRRRWRQLGKVVWETLVPSLKGWQVKSHLGRVVAVVSAPAILVLSLTLPVVDDESVEEVVEESDSGAEESEEEEERLVETSGCVQERRGRNEDRFRMGTLRVVEEAEEVGDLTGSTLMGGREGLSSRAEEEGFSDGQIARGLAVVQCLLAPPFCVLSLVDFESLPLPRLGVPLKPLALLGSTLLGGLSGLLIYHQLESPTSRAKLGLCFIGFAVSMVWILSVVNEVVGVLKCLGSVFGLSDAILGLTVFGIGNSLGDFIANVTVARMGFPVMAMSACFGGPMLNVLLGIGLSSSFLLQTQTSPSSSSPSTTTSHHHHHQRQSIEFGSTHTLLVSAIGLLVVLITMMVLVSSRGYLIDRKIGVLLVCEYLVVFGVNCFVEVWSERRGGK